ncbi:MAG: sensor histidine kinase [Acetatifactor sp.]
MSFRDYIGSKALSLCVGGIGILYLLFIFCLCQIPFFLTGIILLNTLLVTTVWILIGWRRADRKLRHLKHRLEALPEKYLIGETLDRPRDAVELQYYLLMKEISSSAIGAVEQAKTEQQDYCDYVESWVHEIKTPLTACSLILANGGDSAKLRRELRRADNLTETILTYAKLRTVEKDTQIGLTDLRTVCDQAVREEMELLIAAGIAVSIQGEGRVYTDAKRLIFILKQLLINCAKYCPGCQIRIELGEDSLLLEDNGPGIPAHELRRVTERGFIGTIGRSQGGSTGMGLYIVSQLCESLNIRMELTSKEGSYTRFTFQFSAPTLQNC